MYDGTPRSEIPAEERNLGLVFQSYALWPHKTVFDNVAYPLKLRKVAAGEIKERVQRVLDQLGLGHLGNRHPHQLSGGQQQRVAIGRALVYNPPVILLDEPFTGVDVQTEARIISLLRELRDEGCTMLVSTHNLGSVSEFCDYTVMVKGTVLASGPTETTFTAENLERAFSGVLRHVALTGGEAQVITDDERPFISRRAAGGPR